MVQVLTNLVDNAIKSTPSKGHVKVRVKDIGYQIAVEVQDNGLIIASKEVDKVFNLFALVDEQLHPDKIVLAFGLPLAGQLVEMHSGCIWIESEHEWGNSFCFTLPKCSIGKERAFVGVKIREKLLLGS